MPWQEVLTKFATRLVQESCCDLEQGASERKLHELNYIRGSIKITLLHISYSSQSLSRNCHWRRNLFLPECSAEDGT
jgi:hypothetical protein